MGESRSGADSWDGRSDLRTAVHGLGAMLGGGGGGSRAYNHLRRRAGRNQRLLFRSSRGIGRSRSGGVGNDWVSGRSRSHEGRSRRWIHAGEDVVWCGVVGKGVVCWVVCWCSRDEWEPNIKSDGQTKHNRAVDIV
jgi:hypothetical protein